MDLLKSGDKACVVLFRRESTDVAHELRNSVDICQFRDCVAGRCGIHRLWHFDPAAHDQYAVTWHPVSLIKVLCACLTYRQYVRHGPADPASPISFIGPPNPVAGNTDIAIDDWAGGTGETPTKG